MKLALKLKKVFVLLYIILSGTVFNMTRVIAQQVEVQGELKVTQMTSDDTQENLVIHNTDGTLGTRSVASLPPPPPPIDTTRNLASDYELAKQLCDCPNLPPFLIQKLLDSGYTEADLLGAGISVDDIYNSQKYGTLVDSRDNQSYTTIRIGTQTWMAENLNFGTMINGSSNQTNNSTIEKYCYDDLASNCTTYGGLYQWDEMMQYTSAESTQGICPIGWHVPSDTEYRTLEQYLGMCSGTGPGCSLHIGFRGTDEGSQLAGNTALWINSNLTQNANFGTSGIAALPGGDRDISGSFINQSNSAVLWSSSESGGNAWLRYVFYSTPKVNRNTYDKAFGFSVLCVQD